MPGLLYPAYQKFYSAISSLERFSKEANFFDNISCLDTFFSEYRNVTFIIQSQLKHTDFYEKYEKKQGQISHRSLVCRKEEWNNKTATISLSKENHDICLYT